MKIALLILISLLPVSFPSFGQSGSCRTSSKGTDFWFGFMQNSAAAPYQFWPTCPESYSQLHWGEITVASEVEADFNITIGHLETPYGGTYHVSALDTVKVRFDIDLLRNKAVHLTSTDSVSVFALNFSEYTSDIAMIHPTASLGKEYFAMCYQPDIYNCYVDIVGPICLLQVPLHVNFVHEPYPIHPVLFNGIYPNSEFLIVATEDNTTVTITPSSTPFTVTI